jgi:acyl carrier protein
MMTVASDVIEVISKKVRSGKKDITLDDRLEDLGLESIDAIEMIFDLEEKFDIQIPYNANNTQLYMTTVGEVVKAIEDIVAKKNAGAA